MALPRLSEALTSAEAELAVALAELNRRRAAMREQEEVVGVLQAEVNGIRLAVDRHSGSDQKPRQWLQVIANVAVAVSAQQVTRTDAIVQVLEAADQPMSPTQLVQALAQAGRIENVHAISATLSHLANYNRVERVGRGQWQALKKPLERPSVPEGGVAPPQGEIASASNTDSPKGPQTEAQAPGLRSDESRGVGPDQPGSLGRAPVEGNPATAMSHPLASLAETDSPSTRRQNMSSDKNRHVVPNPDGGWDVKKPGGERASSHHDTQADAIGRAREIVQNVGGGEVTIHGRDGRIRDSDTVAPGNDPNPPRDRK